MADEPLRTRRLELWRPTAADTEALFGIFSDPRVWRHYPSLRHERHDQTGAMLVGWLDSWRESGLGTWVVRQPGEQRVIGCGGCTLLRGQVWNLGYRFAPDLHGHGYATEVAEAAIERAHDVVPARPVIAFMVEHNAASAKVAVKAGLELVLRVPDPGNPDPSVHRLVYADRPLTAAQEAAASA